MAIPILNGGQQYASSDTVCQKVEKYNELVLIVNELRQSLIDLYGDVGELHPAASSPDGDLVQVDIETQVVTFDYQGLMAKVSQNAAEWKTLIDTRVSSIESNPNGQWVINYTDGTTETFTVEADSILFSNAENATLNYISTANLDSVLVQLDSAIKQAQTQVNETTGISTDVGQVLSLGSDGKVFLDISLLPTFV